MIASTLVPFNVAVAVEVVAVAATVTRTGGGAVVVESRCV